jgi:phosphoglycolate phosphatase
MNYLFFDFDGTIIESLPATIGIINDLAEKSGFKKITDTQKTLFGDNGSREVIKNLGIPFYRLPKLINAVRKGLEENMDRISPVPDLEPVLESLCHSGIRLAILTSNSQASVNRFLAKHNWNYFDFVFSGSSLFGKGKVLKRLIKEKGLSKDEAIYVGDETRDIEAAHAARVKAVAVTWGYNSQKPLAALHPDWLTDKPQDLLKL